MADEAIERPSEGGTLEDHEVDAVVGGRNGPEQQVPVEGFDTC